MSSSRTIFLLITTCFFSRSCSETLCDNNSTTKCSNDTGKASSGVVPYFSNKQSFLANVQKLFNLINEFSAAVDTYLRDGAINFDVGSGMKVNLKQGVNDVVKLSFDNRAQNGAENDSRGMKKKMKSIMKYIPFLLLPFLILAGITPWILPVLKIAAFFAGMLNNFVFTQALFALVRNYVFNDKKEEHIVYLNHGYNKKKHNYHKPYIPYTHGPNVR